MPAARKRTGSKLSAATSSTAPPKNKKKRGAVQLEIPSAPKKRGHVLVCGQGDVGQLGLGEDVEETTRFKLVSSLGNKIVDVIAGGMHTIALDSDGKVWTFGCNDEGALGRPTRNEQDEGTPATVALPSRAVAVAAGDSHSAALLHNGDVYAWGAFRDSHGSMGLVVRGREGKACKEPVKVDVGEAGVAIASGGDHLVILTTSGSVYTMGCGEQGQLGRLSQRSASRDARQGFSALLAPMKVTLKGGASRVWAGYHATFALDANGKVLAWGLNNYGQLGISGEKRKTALFSPTECDAFDSSRAWDALAAGQHHSLALDAAGQAYAIGRCEYGRLGLGDRAGDAEALEPIPKLQNKKCVSIAAGTSNSFAVTDAGEVVAWGMGSEGQLGTGARNDQTEPTPAPAAAAPPGTTPLRVSAGGQHTVLLVEDPSAQKEESPAPEQETSEQKADDVTEEEEEEEETQPEPEKKKPRLNKRGKKQEQEDEVSSTSSAPAQPKQKLNGDEKKDTAMDVDETDKPQEEEKEDTNTEPETETEPEPEPEPEAEAAKTETEAEPEQDVEMKEESKPETTDTSSQETTDSDAKSQETVEETSQPSQKTELNGESETIEPKTVESIPPATTLTTTA